MISSIEIRNFRGIQSGKLEDLTPLTILVGPNGCGKSTILDALILGAHRQLFKAVQQLVKERNGLDGMRIRAVMLTTNVFGTIH